MHEPPSLSPEEIENLAAAWVLRTSAGLTEDEEQQLAEWLAADPRHEASFAEHQRAWDRFEPLAERSLAPATKPSSHRLRSWAWSIAAAAAVALGIFVWRQPTLDTSSTPMVASVALPALCERQILPDGTTVELNRGAEIHERFTGNERLVELVRGEAVFTVTKDPARPFIVSAGGVRVRAVGTVFNVRFASGSVEVVVTEGRVEVAAPPPAPGAEPEPSRPVLNAGDSVLVPLQAAETAPVVARLSAAELEQKLAWQPRLLEFDDVALADIVAEFNRRNPVQLVVADPALGAEHLTISFRSDNLEGFVRLLENNYDVRVETRGPAVIGLGRR